MPKAQSESVCFSEVRSARRKSPRRHSSTTLGKENYAACMLQPKKHARCLLNMTRKTAIMVQDGTSPASPKGKQDLSLPRFPAVATPLPPTSPFLHPFPPTVQTPSPSTPPSNVQGKDLLEIEFTKLETIVKTLEDLAEEFIVHVGEAQQEFKALKGALQAAEELFAQLDASATNSDAIRVVPGDPPASEPHACSGQQSSYSSDNHDSTPSESAWVDDMSDADWREHFGGLSRDYVTGGAFLQWESCRNSAAILGLFCGNGEGSDSEPSQLPANLKLEEWRHHHDQPVMITAMRPDGGGDPFDHYVFERQVPSPSASESSEDSGSVTAHTNLQVVPRDNYSALSTHWQLPKACMSTTTSTTGVMGPTPASFNSAHTCVCGKAFRINASLSRHKKKCNKSGEATCGLLAQAKTYWLEKSGSTRRQRDGVADSEASNHIVSTSGSTAVTMTVVGAISTSTFLPVVGVVGIDHNQRFGQPLVSQPALINPPPTLVHNSQPTMTIPVANPSESPTASGIQTASVQSWQATPSSTVSKAQAEATARWTPGLPLHPPSSSHPPSYDCSPSPRGLPEPNHTAHGHPQSTQYHPNILLQGSVTVSAISQPETQATVGSNRVYDISPAVAGTSTPQTTLSPNGHKYIDSQPDQFGLWRQYYCHELPTHDPHLHVSPLDVYDCKSQSRNDELFIPDLDSSTANHSQRSSTGTIINEDPHNDSLGSTQRPFGPFQNESSFNLSDWYWNQGTRRSFANVGALRALITADGFSPDDIDKTNWKKMDQHLGANREELGASKGEWIEDDGWNTHWELQDGPGEPGCDLPWVLVGLMFWSDQTHLTSFGNSKVWPLYMFFRNESKYWQSESSCRLGSHVAYFKSLPEHLKDFITERSGGPMPDKLKTYLVREFFHAQWSIILNDKLIKAMVHGIVFLCSDGKKRRFYLQIFTYSADFPEKLLIAALRRGKCPCPRCKTPLSKFHAMGKTEDISVESARKAIAGGAAPYGKAVETILEPYHLYPVLNPLASKLRLPNRFPKFNLFSLLVVDLLHEFEIGVWKSTFTHLIRILTALGQGLVDELDHTVWFQHSVELYGNSHQILPTCSTLTRWQCAIAVFESLVPAPHNDIIIKLLFLCCQWHALAKLHMHTDYTTSKQDGNLSKLVDPQPVDSNAPSLETGDRTSALPDTVMQNPPPVTELSVSATTNPSLLVQHPPMERQGVTQSVLPHVERNPMDDASSCDPCDPTPTPHCETPNPSLAASEMPHGYLTSLATSYPGQRMCEGGTRLAPQQTASSHCHVDFFPPLRSTDMEVDGAMPTLAQETVAPILPPQGTSSIHSSHKDLPTPSIIDVDRTGSSQHHFAMDTTPHEARDLLNESGEGSGRIVLKIPRLVWNKVITEKNENRGRGCGRGRGGKGRTQPTINMAVTTVGPTPSGVSDTSTNFIDDPLPSAETATDTANCSRFASLLDSRENMEPSNTGVINLIDTPAQIQSPQAVHEEVLVDPTPSKPTSGRRIKTLNLSTYKFHALGDYADAIVELGTSDLHTSETGEELHKEPKSWYPRTNKRRLERNKNRDSEFQEQQRAARLVDLPYYIGTSENHYHSLTEFARNGPHGEDPAINHHPLTSLFPELYVQTEVPFARSAANRTTRVSGLGLPSYAGVPNYPEDWSRVIVKDNQIFTHKIFQIKYLTYDLRRNEDLIHIETDNCNVMLQNPEFRSDSLTPVHPYRYAKVLGICHANFDLAGIIGPRLPVGSDGKAVKEFTIEFLWVRWYTFQPAVTAFHLDILKHAPISSPESTGFVSPDEVLRTCHLIPRFTLGRSYPTGAGQSPLAQDSREWEAYYINRAARFVDRDMFMRYQWGHGVGHAYSRLSAPPSLAAYDDTGTLVEDVDLNEVHALEESDSETDRSVTSDHESLDIDDEREIEMFGVDF
ncbi:hypothetical protein FA15DRAFT_655145 [Coprinopsis marcescibilis]|uniref:Uncharacterized protein n=1 Tax=Coprinopsis marcescibilis TaxID=230819 RepID=A0A5C3LB07_COPMA|nr:hypothetical protein FA15DRAFT_655145 [Coprinopsis marcescibilis]